MAWRTNYSGGVSPYAVGSNVVYPSFKDKMQNTAMQRYMEAYQKAMEFAQQGIGAAKNAVGKGTPDEYTQLVDLFQPGGQYGAGIKSMIDQNTQKDVANVMQNQIATGMSSSTNANALKLAALRNRTTQYAGVEDDRIAKLASALSEKGGASMANRDLLMKAYLSASNLAAGANFH